MKNLVEIDHLRLRRGKNFTLDDLSFALHRNKIVGLTGPNGGGKTTLLETLLGWLKPIEGEILWNAPTSMAYLSQNSRRLDTLPLSVKNFIALGLWANEPANKAALTVDEALEFFKLRDLANTQVRELSGGQWQRVLMARTLAQPADLYLLDEPFNHLDLAMEHACGHLFKDLVTKKDKTFLIVTHDWHAMLEFFDETHWLNRQVLAHGNPKDIFERAHNLQDPHAHQWEHRL